MYLIKIEIGIKNVDELLETIREHMREILQRNLEDIIKLINVHLL
jgi:hypothetical protein